MKAKTNIGDLMFSTGNMKMKKTYIFNLPARITCKFTKICFEKCYARKAEYLYPQVLPCRMNNLSIVQNTSSWVHAVVNKLRKGRFSFCRLHESGDFISQRYLNQWIAIAQAIPKIQFMAFTKNYALDYSRLPRNFKVVFSVMEDSENVPTTKPQAFAGNVEGLSNYLECNGGCHDCRLCWNLEKLGKNIHFKMH